MLIEIWKCLKDWNIFFSLGSFSFNTRRHLFKDLLCSVYVVFFQRSLSFIVIKLRIHQSKNTLNVLFVDKFSNQITLFLGHVNVVCTKFNIDSRKSGRSYSATKPVSALEDNVRDSLFWEGSGSSNAWNSCTDDDDFVDLLHLRC